MIWPNVEQNSGRLILVRGVVGAGFLLIVSGVGSHGLISHHTINAQSIIFVLCCATKNMLKRYPAGNKILIGEYGKKENPSRYIIEETARTIQKLFGTYYAPY